MFQMVAQSIARNAVQTLLRAKSVQFVATCALVGFNGGCDKLSDQQLDVLTDIP